MTSKKLGKNSLASITMISPSGIWMMVSNTEFFLKHKDFPWFQNAKVAEVMDVELLGSSHLYWPALDVDVHLDSVKNPKMYPLVSVR